MFKYWLKHAMVAGITATTGLTFGCDDAPARGLLLAPSPTAVATTTIPAPSAGLRIFTGTGGDWHFSTTDVYDAQGHMVQFEKSGDLIWTADGRHLPGFYSREGDTYIDGFAASGTWFIVRLGMENGQTRAYLTVVDDEGLNPGTLADLDIVGDKLVVGRTNLFPPGTHTLSGYTVSGVVTEITPNGMMPIEGAFVMLNYSAGNDYQRATTDSAGRFEIRGLYNGVKGFAVYKEGYEFLTQPVSIQGDTKVDLQLTRR
jgi:hypothetical protein